jgi:hypothetical protein
MGIVRPARATLSVRQNTGLQKRFLLRASHSSSVEVTSRRTFDVGTVAVTVPTSVSVQ